MGCVSTKVKGEGDYGDKDEVIQESSKECRNPLGSRKRSGSERNLGRSEPSAIHEMPPTQMDEGETHFTKIELWVNTVEQYRQFFSTYPPIPQTPQSHPSDDVSQTSWHQARSSQSSDANCSDSRSFRTRGSVVDLVAISSTRPNGRRLTDGGSKPPAGEGEGALSQTDEEGEKTETTMRASDMQNESNAGSQVTDDIRGGGVVVASKPTDTADTADEADTSKEPQPPATPPPPPHQPTEASPAIANSSPSVPAGDDENHRQEPLVESEHQHQQEEG